jgi:hypothetical protein
VYIPLASTEEFLMKNALRLLACWLGIIVTSSAAQLPQIPPPTFRIGINAVQLDVSVLDAQRRPVRGLTAADFTVLEDGKPRRIVQFSAVELPSVAPVAPAAADAVQPDVVRNDLPKGRLVGLRVACRSDGPWGHHCIEICRSP